MNPCCTRKQTYAGLRNFNDNIESMFFFFRAPQLCTDPPRHSCAWSAHQDHGTPSSLCVHGRWQEEVRRSRVHPVVTGGTDRSTVYGNWKKHQKSVQISGHDMGRCWCFYFEEMSFNIYFFMIFHSYISCIWVDFFGASHLLLGDLRLDILDYFLNIYLW